jgi:hypothetical protein
MDVFVRTPFWLMQLSEKYANNYECKAQVEFFQSGDSLILAHRHGGAAQNIPRKSR